MKAKRTANVPYAIVWLALLAVCAAMLGGSSRFDAVQNVALRPIAALFLVPALYWITTQKLELARIPLALLALTGIWTAIQLIPLPPFMWQMLPDREAIAQLDMIHGIDGTWRPISFAPMRGWNALFQMVVPVSAVLLALALKPQARTLMIVLVGLGALDAAFGLLQVLGGGAGALYFYEYTNAGRAVGIFANENHSGVFSAMTLLIIGRLAFGSSKAGQSPATGIALAAVFLLVSVGLLISGSRAAFGLGIAAYAIVGIMAFLWVRSPSHKGEPDAPPSFVLKHPKAILTAAIALIAALIFALMQVERAPGLASALGQNAFEDLRWRLGPILFEMMSSHWLIGTGFGSFDEVFNIYEPTGMMRQSYLNQAHNDWAQIVIEGGLPGILLLLAALRWIGFAIAKVFDRNSQAIIRAIFWCATFAFLAIASVFDYPLRTPTFQVATAWLLLSLALDAQGKAPLPAAK